MPRFLTLVVFLSAFGLSPAWSAGGAGGTVAAGGAGGALVTPPVVVSVAPAADELGLAKQIWEATTQRNYWLVGALALILLVMAARRFGAAKFPWLKTGKGGVVLTALVGVGSGMALNLLAGQKMSTDVLLAGLKMAWVAAGGYTAFKNWLEPSAAPPA